MSEKSHDSDAGWRARLTAEQFAVTRGKATEPPFSGTYEACHEPGVYRCVCCGAELFRSDDKYDSGSGWPSFTRPAGAEAVRIELDHSAGTVREEVVCNACDAHLGHRFDDGPRAATGQRYCINSVALDLERR